MQLRPPFDFDGVSVRVFPLRAKLHALQRFCDDYINIIPRQTGNFHPFVPFVYMFVVNYGRMAVKAAKLGWLSQHEIVFAIPVEVYVWEGGEWAFREWGLVTPFIYVDNTLSMTTGRMVYGWPKALVKLNPEISSWADRPGEPISLLSVAGPIFSDAGAASRNEDRTFLEIHFDSSRVGTQLIPSALRRTPSLTRDFADILLDLGSLPRFPGHSLEDWASRLRVLFGRLNPVNPNVFFNNFNLKQFRASDDAKLACYQAVTSSTMNLRRINDGGLLGRGALLGDPSAGYRIHLHRYKTYPIIENLGLKVEEQRRGPEADVAEIAPYFPFWIDMDLRYDLGGTLAWRARGTDWVVPGKEKLIVPGEEKLPKPRPARGCGPKLPPYNSVSGSTRAILGPFDMPNMTLGVLPLLANKMKLQERCDRYLNRPLLGRDAGDKPLKKKDRLFDVWGSYVYLVIAKHESGVSETEAIGWWADRDITFYVPVKWYKPDPKGGRRLRSLALVPFFSYANSETAAITGSEVSGVPIMKADIESPLTDWMDESGPSEATKKCFVRMKTMMFQAIGEGVQAQEQTLLELWSGHMYPLNDEEQWTQVAQDWDQKLKDELERKKRCTEKYAAKFDRARLLALEVLANNQPLNILTLKQFRDVADPRVACYQALNLIRRSIKHVYDIREIESRLYVSIYSYQSQPIVDDLGLVPATTRYDGDVREHVLQPVRPFWMRVKMREEKAVALKFRAGDTTWRDASEAKLQHYFKKGGPWIVPLMVGEKTIFCKIKEKNASQCLRAIVLESASSDKGKGKDEDLRDAQRRAVETIEPQMIIEPALSEKWEQWGDRRRNQKKDPKDHFWIPGWTLEEEARTRELAIEADALHSGPK